MKETFSTLEKHIRSFPDPIVDIEEDPNVTFNRKDLWHWYMSLMVRFSNLKNSQSNNSKPSSEESK